MFKGCFVPAVTCALLLAASPVRAQEDEARAVLEKAIKAHGGAEKLAQAKAVQTKGKGKMQLMGNDAAFTIDSQVQFPDGFKNAMQMEFNNMNFAITAVFNGKKGWVSVLNMTKEFEEKDLQAIHRSLHAEGMGRLVHLRDKKFKLSPLGEAQVNDRAAVGLLVTCEGKPDVNLFFDKQSHLLVKLEYRTTAPMSAQEVTETRFYRDYKEIDGRQSPTRIEVQHDGKVYLDLEVTEARVVDGFDDSVFARPE